jgi:hypothetical protein
MVTESVDVHSISLPLLILTKASAINVFKLTMPSPIKK